MSATPLRVTEWATLGVGLTTLSTPASVMYPNSPL
ncbi:MAG: hypothetical protein J07HX64_02043 [halophilic archaeon J07HX64]|nr:MAG: hypothetical protein J07HX64_02043 [halophilic archaeon J07HX64]